jgi:hypothetical protein
MPKNETYLPPPENINTLYSYEKITRLNSGNFIMNRPLSSYMHAKIENTIQDYQNSQFILKNKRDTSIDRQEKSTE